MFGYAWAASDALVPPNIEKFVTTGTGMLVYTAVTLALVAGMTNEVTGDIALLMPAAPDQFAKVFPVDAGFALSVTIEPAPKFPPPLPFVTVSAYAFAALVFHSRKTWRNANGSLVGAG